MMTDIHQYLAEFDDIPGTRVYTAARARKGYHLNQFCMSLMKPENRARWKADEAAYQHDHCRRRVAQIKLMDAEAPKENCKKSGCDLRL